MVILKKGLILFLILLGIQGCIRYYPEKKYIINEEYTDAEEQAEESKNNYINEKDLGIDIFAFFYGNLKIYIYENKMSKSLYLDNVRLYDENELLGEMKINKKLLDIKDKKYTDNGRLIYEVELKDQFLETLGDKEEELKIRRYAVSKKIKFLFEFYDEEKNQKYFIMNYYKISKYDKGWEFWMPDI